MPKRPTPLPPQDPPPEAAKSLPGSTLRPDALDRLGTGFSASPQAESHERPTILSERFEYIEPLGGGGQGVVWRALDRQEGREVAVKLLHPRLRGEERWLRLAKREMQILHAIRHPHVIQTLAIFPEEAAFSMELLQGETLQTRLERGPLPLLEALGFLEETLDALDALHTAGLIHRDIKPANLFLTASEPPKLILLDLGIAHVPGRSLLSLTAGTPYYMAPEIVQGSGEITPQADLYSVGILLYTLLTGEIPILGSPDLTEGLTAIVDRASSAPLLPSKIEAIIACLRDDLAPLYRSLIQRDPSQRPTLQNLRQAVTSIQHRLRPFFEPQRPRFPAMALPLSFALQPAYSTLPTGTTLSLPLLLQLQAIHESQVDLQARPPVALSLCIDNSGSMQGQPMELVLDSIRLISEHLKDTDQIAVISFSNDAKIWLPLQPHQAQAKAAIQTILAELKADASTAMFAGLDAALDDLRKSESLLPRRLLLLTDGHPNSGPSSADALARIVRQKRGGTVVSTFGYGSNHNESILQAIATAGGGGYTYVESESMAPAAFAQEIGALFSTVARNARMILQPHRGCKVLRVRGDLEQAFSSEGLEVKLTDFIAGQKAEILADLEIDTSVAHPEGEPWATLRLTFWPPEEPEPIVVEKELHLSLQAHAPLDIAPDVSRLLLLFEVAEAWKEAKGFADHRDFAKAAAHLQPFLARLQAEPSWADEGGPIRDWYEQIVDEIEVYKSRPTAEQYQGFRKQSVAEMNLPGTPVYASKMSKLSLDQQNLVQQGIMESFRLDSHAEAYLERLDRQDHVLQRIPIQGKFSIGRVPGNEFQISSGSVSKRHAMIYPDKHGFLLSDLRTSNGTYLNGQLLTTPTHLKDGDRIQIGDVFFRFVLA